MQKHKEGAICAILREKPHFSAFPETKKGVVNYARLRKAAHWPNNNANPSGLSEKKRLLCRKARYVRSLGKKPNFWPSQRLKKVNWHSAKVQNVLRAFNPSGKIRKKFLLCKSTKKARYVRSLGKKPHFGAFPEAKKGVVNYARLRKAAHWPNNNANPSGLSE